jgi:hypothetical protein
MALIPKVAYDLPENSGIDLARTIHFQCSETKAV